MLFLLAAGLLAGFLLERLLYGRFWSRGLTIRAQFADAYVYEGETSSLKEEVINDKILPLPALEVWLQVSRNLRFSDADRQNASVSDKAYRRDVFAVLSRERIVRTLSFGCPKRGFYQIDRLEAQGKDILYSLEYRTEFPQKTQLYVYPARVDARRIELVCSALSGMMPLHRRLFPDPFEFAGIREYRTSDPMRSVNWKASAKSGTLMVNQFDSSTDLKVTVILDVEDSHILRQESLIEESIRIAASLAARLAGQNLTMSLRSNAVYMDYEDTKPKQKEVSWEMKTGVRTLRALECMLSCIDTQVPAKPVTHLIRLQGEQKDTGSIVVLISKNQNPEILKALRVLAAQGMSVLWVVPVLPGDALTVSAVPPILVVPWEVGRG